MAQCTVNGFDDFLRQINSLSDNTETICKACLNESAPIVVNKWKQNLETHRDTGQLIDSIKATKAKYDSKYNDYCVKIKPDGYAVYTSNTGTTHKVANAIKANVLEYGKNGQAGSPTLAPAVVATKAEVLQSWQQTFDKLVGSDTQ